MSAYYTKVIPVNPFCRVDAQTARTVQRYLEEHMMAMSVEIEMQEHPAFIDCGGYLEKIACPFCGSELSDWWAEAMDEAAGETGLFASLDAMRLPCCGRYASLKDLCYTAPCGFACTAFILLHPRKQLEWYHLREVERLLGTQVSVIESRI